MVLTMQDKPVKVFHEGVSAPKGYHNSTYNRADTGSGQGHGEGSHGDRLEVQDLGVHIHRG